VHTAGKELFLIQGGDPQLLNWEKYGMRIYVSKGTLLSLETAEVAVVAIVGGQFEFPAKTQLVSAIYAISVSRPLIEPLRLDLQHCVNITKQSQIKHLKFVTASFDTPNLPYLFKTVEGGEFTLYNQYGSIYRQKFSFVAIVANKNDDVQPQALLDDPDPTPPSSSDEDEYHSDDVNDGQDEQNDNTSSSTSSDNELVTSPEHNEEVKSKPVESSSQESTTDKLDHVYSAQAVELVYAGVKFDKTNKDKDYVEFATTKHLDALLMYIKSNYPQADTEPCFQFSFQQPSNYIELIFDDTHQRDPCTGWIIRPQIQPCKLLKNHIDNFGSNDPPVPASCLISVFSENTPNTVPVLNYGIPLEGIYPPIAICIHRTLKALASTSTPLQVASSGVQSIPPTKDDKIKQLIKVIEKVLQTHHADLTSLLKDCHQELADQLFASRLISTTVKNNPSMDKCISEFSSSLKWLKQQSKIQSHCTKFLKSFVAVGGSYSTAAEVLREDLIETVNKQLNCDFQLNLDA
jgi:hypothetical protein